jgi:hypothetical protein
MLPRCRGTHLRFARGASLAIVGLVAAIAHAAPAQALIRDQTRTATADFSGAGCQQVVRTPVSRTLPRGARKVRIASPRPGETLYDWNTGEPVAEVVSVGAVQRTGREATTVVSTRGIAATCATPESPGGVPWETEPTDIEFRYRGRVRVYFPHSCCGNRHDYKPRFLLLGASFALDRARWQRWNGPVAKGTARLPYNDCVPYCAAGTTTYYRVSVRLSRARLCNGVYQYLTLRYRYLGRRPPGAPFSATSHFGFRCTD